MLLEGLVIPVSFDTGLLLKGIDLVKSAITGAVDATFQWAEGMDALGDATGMSNDKLAAWSFVATKAGVPVDKLTKSMVIMEKGLVKTDGSLDMAGKKLQALGIHVFDANGEIRDQSSLMDDIATKYATFGTQQERVNFLTEIFGRAGADLVDVFDTLSAEGGIDAVTQKVKDMGLAIDPGRYEGFKRNLEEIKMAGLGLQVAFTEQLMPVLEGFLGWVNSLRGMSPGEILQQIGFWADWLAQKFNNWVQRVDWHAVSQGIIDGINSVDWTAIGELVGRFVKNIFEGLKFVVQNVDWGGIFKAVGTAFLEFMAGLTGQKSWDNVKDTWAANWEQLKQIVEKAVNFIIDKINSIPVLPDIPVHLGGGGGSNNSTASTGGGGGGGTRRASGGAAGGLTWVGERGPELVNLPNGSFVNSAQSSQSMSAIDYDELGKSVARYMVPALQTAGIG